MSETTQSTVVHPAGRTETNAPVTIIGASGALGFGLAVRLAREGVHVVIGSRSAERAEDTVRRARELVPEGSVAGATNTDATEAGGVVVLSVPFASQAETLSAIAPALRNDQVLVDATVPLATAVGGRPTRTVAVWQGSAAQQARDLVPAGVGVVSALHTVSAHHLADLDYQLNEHVLMCGDRREDKRRVARLVELVPGLQCIDCGRLEMARFTEQLTPLLISINRRYKTHAGIKVTGLPSQEPGGPGRSVGV